MTAINSGLQQKRRLLQISPTTATGKTSPCTPRKQPPKARTDPRPQTTKIYKKSSWEKMQGVPPSEWQYGHLDSAHGCSTLLGSTSRSPLKQIGFASNHRHRRALVKQKLCQLDFSYWGTFKYFSVNSFKLRISNKDTATSFKTNLDYNPKICRTYFSHCLNRSRQLLKSLLFRNG